MDDGIRFQGLRMNESMDSRRNRAVHTKDAVEVQRWSDVCGDLAKYTPRHGVRPIGDSGRWLQSVNLIRMNVKVSSLDVIVDEAVRVNRRGFKNKTGIADEQLNFMVMGKSNVAEGRVSGVELTAHGTV